MPPFDPRSLRCKQARQLISRVRWFHPASGIVTRTQEGIELRKQAPGPDRRGVRFPELYFAADRRSMLLKELTGCGRPLGCVFKLPQRPPPAQRHQVRQRERQTLLTGCPLREVQVRLHLSDPALPDGTAVRVLQPAPEQLPVVFPQRNRRKTVGKRKIDRLAIAQVSLREREHLNQPPEPRRRTDFRRVKPIAIPNHPGEFRRQTLGFQCLPLRFGRGRQVEDGLLKVSYQLFLCPVRRQCAVPVGRRLGGEFGRVLGEQGVLATVVQSALLRWILGQIDSRLPQEAEQGGLLSIQPPGNTSQAVLGKQFEMVLPVRIRGVQAIFGEGQIDHEPVLGRRAATDLILQPDLAMEGRLLVLKERKRSRSQGRQVLVQPREDSVELALLVEPQADPRPLLVLEASREVVD